MNTTRVKICGITTLDDALLAAQAGADLIGLNFYPKSPRYLAPAAARDLCQALRQATGPACPVLVGVFVNATDSDIDSIYRQVGLDFVQLSGDESVEMMTALGRRVFKAIQPDSAAAALAEVQYFQPVFSPDDRVPSLLLDAFHPTLRGGTGAVVSQALALAVKAAVPRVLLAGGLTPENVAERVQSIAPWGVDVASGVEAGTPGRKDAARMHAFIAAAKGAL
ncbi:MAG: phosphoribosylanthranilate isomerase [Anaerolineae bacterium]|jgi:phosphoribosylanthranilate isomerase|nr:phosphoribosylanthranilate isomerase [Anaerolineae bacterium]